MNPPPAALQKPRLLTIAVLAALIAFGFSLGLAMQSMGNATLPGCNDAGTGCLNVLNSTWSKFLGLPVAGLSVLFYAGLTVLLVHQSLAPANAQASPNPVSAKLLLVFAGNAACAALFFTGVQAFVLKTFCPYCCAAHAAGFTAAVCIFVSLGKPLTVAAAPLGLGGLLFAAFASIQIVFPSPLSVSQPAQHLAFQDTGPGPDRLITYPSAQAGAGVRINPHQMPIHGDPDAPVVALLCHDYTCGYCALTHKAMAAALDRFGDQLAVVIAPTARDQPQARRLRDLALAVYLSAPEKFAAFDDYLFRLEPGEFVTVQEARAFAETLVDADALDAAIASEAQKDLAKRLDTLHEIAGASYPLLIIENNVWAGTSILFVEQIPDFLDLLQQLTMLGGSGDL